MNVRRQLWTLRKDVLYLNLINKKIKFETIKLRFTLKEIPFRVYAIAYLSFLMLPLTTKISWIISFLKGSYAAVAVTTAAGTGIAATATVVVVNTTRQNSVDYSDIKALDLQSNVIQEQILNTEQTPIVSEEQNTKTEAIVKKIENVFEPKLATVLMINGEQLKGTIFQFNKSFIVIEIDGTKQKISQSDIYKILW